NKQLDQAFIAEFNTALQIGLDSRPELIRDIEKSHNYAIDIGVYLTQNIDYHYDADKKRALELFLTYMADLDQ
ncbi:MAG: radical SAM protein, partial [Bacteroidetes bacterium]|nr:radical SAM protein [Bacteroidota bacterium]